MESENIKLAHYVSIKVELAEVKAEVDDAQHNIASVSGSRMSFADIHFYRFPATDTEYAPTRYECSQALIDDPNNHLHQLTREDV